MPIHSAQRAAAEAKVAARREAVAEARGRLAEAETHLVAAEQALGAVTTSETVKFGDDPRDPLATKKGKKSEADK